MGNAYTFDLKIIRYWDRKDYPEKVGNRLTGGYGKKDPPLGLIGLMMSWKFFIKMLKKRPCFFPIYMTAEKNRIEKKMTDFWKKS